MQILYKPILMIQLWHDYVLGQPTMPHSLSENYDISDICHLVPTAECQKILKNLRWVSRSRSTGMVLFGEVDPVAPEDSNTDYRTQIPVNRPYRLTFWLEVKEPTFANFTNLSLRSNRNQVYYFSNRFGTIQSYERENNGGTAETVDYLFLSQELPAYNEGDEYRLGQLVIQGGNTLEALSYQSSASANPASEDWATLPLSQYVSGQDQLPHQELNRSYQIASANPGDTFKFTLTDINGNRPFVQTFTAPETHPPSDPITVSLNFTGQIPGRYRLELDGNSIGEEFVLFSSQVAPRVFGLVEIVVVADASDPFALLRTDGSDTLIQPRTYIIRFKNRATCWRYRTQKPHGLTDAVLEPEGLTKVDSQTYVTIRPKGLLQKPNPPPLNNSQRNLPFPNAARIKPVTDVDQHVTQVFSDIYL